MLTFILYPYLYNLKPETEGKHAIANQLVEEQE